MLPLTKATMKECTDENVDEKPDVVKSTNRQGFKKNHGKSYATDTRNDFFRGYMFKVGENGPDLYENTIDWLVLYTSTQIKNSSDMVICLRSEEYVGPEAPDMPEKPTENNKHVWDYKMNDLLKIERMLQGNLCNLFTLLILCDTEVKNLVKALPSFKDMEKVGLYDTNEGNQEDSIHQGQRQSRCQA